MINKEESTKISNFRTPGAGDLVLWHGVIVTMQCRILYSMDQTNKLKFKVMMTNEGSNKILNFMTPGAGVLILGRGHVTYFSENALSSSLSIYNTLIVIVLRIYNSLFYAISDFHLFYDGDVDIQI